MSTTLASAIAQVRSVHPAFIRQMVPDQSLADFFTHEQQRLMTLGLMRDRGWLTQSLPILFDLTNADVDAPGTAGAGTTGGVPGTIESGGSLVAVQKTVGSAVTVSDGTVLVAAKVVAAATATTAQLTGVSWTSNAYANRLAVIVAGTGFGTSPRTIASNTSDTLTVSADWEVTPDTTSMVKVVSGLDSIDGTTGLVTDVPNLSEARGYSVKLNASGQPYVDYTAPVIGHVTDGIPLPPYQAILGGIVRYLQSSGAPQSTAQFDYQATQLWLVDEKNRWSPKHRPAAYVQNNTLYLIGNRAEWQYVESIELKYVPIPPAFAARTDYFLLPDTAIPCAVANGAVFAASRIYGLEGVPQIPTDLLVAQAQKAEQAFVDTLALTSRARVHRVRPGFK